MMKDRLNSLYDKIAPIRDDDEIIRAVIGKAENMDTNSKKRTAKRPVLIACAAALTLCVGVSAAAATGLIDFGELFGGRVAVADNERASVLLAEVSGQHLMISNDDYNVELKGVVGDDTAVIGHIEITRKDGKPVSDDFMNEPVSKYHTDWLYGLDETQLIPSEFYVKVLDSDSSWDSTKSLSIVVNENGNLDIYFDIFSCAGDTDGKKIVITLKNLYTIDESGEKKPVFPEEIWVDFNYLPTQQALTEKMLLVPAEIISAFVFADGEGNSAFAYCNFSSISAHVTVQYENNYNRLIISDTDPNIQLIDNEGNIIAYTGYKSIGCDPDADALEYDLCYYNEDGVRTAVNIEDVVKVRINGTDYDL